METAGLTASDGDAVAILATLKQLTTQSTTPVSKGKAAKIQTNRQRRVFHTLHALHLAFAAAAGQAAADDSVDGQHARSLLQQCEKGTVDTFTRLLAAAEFHYVLTSATAAVLADVLVVLCTALYSKVVAGGLASALKLAQGRNVPRNVRLCTAICVGRALGACGHQLRAIHDASVAFLTKGVRASEACVREACLVGLERAVVGCGRFLAAQHRSIFQVSACGRACVAA